MTAHNPETQWFQSLLGNNEMAERTSRFDWASTPLGPMDTWPQSLRSTVSMALANSFPMAIIWGKEYIQIYNDAFIPIAGYNHPSMLGNHCWNTWAEIWHDILEPTLIHIRQTGKAVITENQHFPVLRFGYMEEVYCLIAYSPLRNDFGEIEGFLITISETTGQVLGERRLETLRDLGAQASKGRSSQEACRLATSVFQQNTMDIPFALIYLLDETGERAHLSCTAGIEPGQSASPDSIILNSTHSSPWPLYQAMTSGLQQLDDLVARFGPLPGGPWPESPRTALVLPLESQTHDTPMGFLVAGISPRRECDEHYREFLTLVATQVATAVANAQAYEQERLRAEALAKLDQAKTAFFSNVSHEFRTPLTLILGLLEDMLHCAETAPDQREALNIAHRNAVRLLKLVNSLLDFSRIEAGRIQASYWPADLAALTADLASNFRSTIETLDLSFVVDCPPLPEPVYVDPDMWEKIVLNLLSNAVKHTFEGQIEVRLAWQGQSVALTVRDTGVGIPADQLPHLFERFHRVPNARSRTHEGTGIGLALVLELVKLHGGTITVQSAPDQGSAFTVSIPNGKAHLPADRIQTESQLSSTAIGAGYFVEETWRWLPHTAPHQPAIPETDTVNSTEVQPSKSIRPRIVLADDNADMRAYVTRLLEPFYEVIAVPDGEAAWNTVWETRPDLLLTDVMMPRLDGFGLLRKLRSDPETRALPVIMLSARAGEEAGIEGLEAGADDYLVKPFSASELLARLRANLTMARLRQDVEKELREAEKMKVVGQLAGGLAHDFNSLLTVLFGRLDMLAAHISDPEGQHLLHSATSVAERSARLVKQILAFARKQPLHLEAIQLNTLITQWQDLLATTLGRRNLLKTRLANPLPLVLIDTHQMEMMLLNVILNARDAMPAGGSVIITTETMRMAQATPDLAAGEYVRLSISDTGVGMSPDLQRQAFEPFFTTKDIGEGTGLGLSQVYGTARQLGGTVQLTSIPENGTTIDIIVPCAPARESV